MSGVTWSQHQVASGGNTIRFRQTGPPIPGLGAAMDQVQSQFLKLAAEIAQRLTAAAGFAVSWAEFHPIVAVGSGWIRAGTGSDNPVLGFWVLGTAPHWPPWGPGSPLAGWAAARGIPAFLVARKISQSGTPGHTTLTQVVQAEQPRVEAQIKALMQVVLNA